MQTGKIILNYMRDEWFSFKIKYFIFMLFIIEVGNYKIMITVVPPYTFDNVAC